MTDAGRPSTTDPEAKAHRKACDSLRAQILGQHPAVYWFTALAFILRIVARFAQGTSLLWVDGYGFYLEFARSIVTGRGIAFADGNPESYRVPFYSIVLAAVTFGHQWAWPVVIFQSLIGAGTAFCAALLARQMFPANQGRSAAILAAAVTAIYPFYVFHDTAIQETSLFTLLTIVAVILAQQIAQTGALRLSALCGLLLGIDILTRSPIVPFALLVPLWLIWRRHLRPALLCAFMMALIVAPWIWRNYKLTGVPTLTTEAGFELWNGNNALLFQYYPLQSVDASIAANMLALPVQDQEDLDNFSLNRAVIDRKYQKLGVDYMRAHPWLTVTNGVRKIGAAFDWLPTPRRSLARTLSHAFSFGPVMVLGLWGMVLRRSKWRNDSLIYLLFGQFLLVTAVYFAQTNHRVFLDVYWIVFGSGALVAAADHYRASHPVPNGNTPLDPNPRLG